MIRIILKKLTLLIFFYAISFINGKAQNNFSETQKKQLTEYIELARQSEKDGKKHLVAQYYNKIAYLYWETGNLNDAVEYFNKTIEFNTSIGNKNAVRIIYGYIGMIYSDMQQFTKSIEYFQKAIGLLQKDSNKTDVASLYINIAVAYAAAEKIDEANKYLFKALEIAQAQNNVKLLRTCYSNLAENYKKTGNNQKSMEYFNFFLSFDKMIKEQEMKDITLNSQIEIAKAEALRKEKELELGLKNYKLKMTTDSLKASEKIASEKQMQIDFLNQEQRIKDLTITQQNERHKFDRFLLYSLVIFVLLVMLFAFVLIKQIRDKRKANHMLAQLNKEMLDQNAQIEIQAILLDNQNKELEKLSIVASHTDNAVIITDAEGNLEWANLAFSKLYGYQFEEYKQKVSSNLIHSSTNNNIREIIDECVEEKKSATYISFTKNRIDEELYTQTTLTPFFDKTGKLLKLIAIESDITKIKSAEKDIHDSILYASRIQNAFLPSKEILKQTFPSSFILFKPRDIVSGDFYWIRKIEHKIFIAAADCTGHGVPGAFMSMLGISFLEQIVEAKAVYQPSNILNELKQMLISSLKQDSDEGKTKDGMDIAFCRFDTDSQILQYAGAYNPLCIVRNQEIIQIKADKMPIGTYVKDKPFTNHIVDIKPNDVYYIYSDGFTDQFGGEKDEKFKNHRFNKLLLDIQQFPIEKQDVILEATFDAWRGSHSQMDDVLIIGFKLETNDSE